MIARNRFRTTASLLSLVAAAAAALAAEKPHVLFLMADDLNCRIGCYGERLVQTPNLDRLAARGIRFDRAYCQYPVCNASRVSLLSGRRPETAGVLDNVTPTRAKLGDAVLLPELFRKNGYRTIKVGKIYHTGEGFEDPRSWDIDIREERTAKNPPEDQVLSERGHRGIVLSANDADAWDGFVARKAIELLREEAARGAAVFCAVGFRRPHAPYIAPKRYHELYPAGKMPLPIEPPEHLARIPPMALTFPPGKPEIADPDVRRETMAAYFASVTFMDAQLGHFLDEASKILPLERTIIVFASDHGYHLGEHGGLWHKMTLFEESHRVPLLLAGPGVRPGQVCPRVVELLDVYPTLAAWAGLERPTGLEGRPLQPLFDDPSRTWDYPAYGVVRRRDRGQGAPGDPNILGRTVRTEEWRYTRWPDGSVELYDHRRDPFEHVNLASDPARRLVRERLSKLLSGAAPSS